MKQIKIIGKTGQIISMIDDDNDTIESYSKKMSNLFESKNVLILHANSSSVIVRPSDIFAIELQNDIIKQEPEEIEAKLEVKVEQPEDTLTDMS